MRYSECRDLGSYNLTPPADPLLELLGKQRLKGGFAVDKQLFSLLSLNWPGFTCATKGRSDLELVFSMVILKALEAHYAARRNEWEPVLEKTRTWLAQELAKQQVQVEGQPLEAWAAAFV
jgi:hypothetical protein